jgi:hypothetical protein
MMNWRSAIEAKLRRPLTDIEWEGLEQLAYIEELEDDSLKIDDLIRDKFPHGRAVPAGREPIDEPVKVSEGLTERAKALAKLYARYAGRPDGDAPPGHKSLRDRLTPSAAVIREEIGPRPKLVDLEDWYKQMWREAWGATAHDEAMRAVATSSIAGTETVAFPYPMDEGGMIVPSNSAAARVAGHIQQLVHDFRWHPYHAARWLISAEEPIPPVTAATVSYSLDGISFLGDAVYVNTDGRQESEIDRKAMVERFRPFTDTRTRITLEVDPAVSPAELGRIYAKARAAIAPDRVRPLTDKALALATFLLDQEENASSAPGSTWDGWISKWNSGPGKKHGGYSRIGASRHNFRRDAKAALQRLRYSGWHARA